jgi:glutathione S-transferase
MKLIIGNKNYSSWSLRPWLLLKQMEIEFEEVIIPLYQENSKSELLKYSPTGKVPTLTYKELTVWDSLAICEFISDLYPKKYCWPKYIQDRAFARSISNEMHSGFNAIRTAMPMNCRKSCLLNIDSKELQEEIDRVSEIWLTCRNQHSSEGPFLFGDFCIADAMFAPIAIRFHSYGVQLNKAQRDYMDTILSLPAIEQWIFAGISEAEFIDQYEVG